MAASVLAHGGAVFAIANWTGTIHGAIVTPRGPDSGRCALAIPCSKGGCKSLVLRSMQNVTHGSLFHGFRNFSGCRVDFRRIFPRWRDLGIMSTALRCAGQRGIPFPPSSTPLRTGADAIKADRAKGPFTAFCLHRWASRESNPMRFIVVPDSERYHIALVRPDTFPSPCFPVSVIPSRRA